MISLHGIFELNILLCIAMYTTPMQHGIISVGIKTKLGNDTMIEVNSIEHKSHLTRANRASAWYSVLTF